MCCDCGMQHDPSKCITDTLPLFLWHILYECTRPIMWCVEHQQKTRTEERMQQLNRILIFTQPNHKDQPSNE